MNEIKFILTHIDPGDHQTCFKFDGEEKIQDAQVMQPAVCLAEKMNEFKFYGGFIMTSY